MVGPDPQQMKIRNGRKSWVFWVLEQQNVMFKMVMWAEPPYACQEVWVCTRFPLDCLWPCPDCRILTLMGKRGDQNSFERTCNRTPVYLVFCVTLSSWWKVHLAWYQMVLWAFSTKYILKPENLLLYYWLLCNAFGEDCGISLEAGWLKRALYLETSWNLGSKSVIVLLVKLEKGFICIPFRLKGQWGKSRNPGLDSGHGLCLGVEAPFGTIVWIPLADLHVGGSRSCEAAISCPHFRVSIPGSNSTLHLVDGLLTGPQGRKSCSQVWGIWIMSPKTMGHSGQGWLALPKPQPLHSPWYLPINLDRVSPGPLRWETKTQKG